jgi:Putative metallopeptidase
MKTILALALASIILFPTLTTKAHARARPDRISVSYVPPKDPTHQAIYERLRAVRFLEQLKEFLSPFRLPRRLHMKMEGCNGDANAEYDDDVITICYEYIDEIWKTVPAETTEAGVTPIDALVGPVFDTCLHEFAHALFDMLQIPVLGREEDAADQVAAYIALQLGRDEARRHIGGTAHAFLAEAKAATTPPTLEQFANEHGTPAQRFYNVLCIAYGADPEFFGGMVAKGYLPKTRAENCAAEYKQAAFAFNRLLGPHIDQRLASKVLKKSWLPEPTRRVPHRGGPKPQ